MKKIFLILLVIVLPLTMHAQKWVNYTTSDGLADNTVNVITVDPQGTEWFGTEYGGVSKFDGTTWTTFNTTNGLANNRVRAINIDEQGNTWIGTIGGGVSKYDGTTWTTYTTSNGLINNNVNAIAIDPQGNKWFGTNAGVSKFDGTTWTSYSNDDLAYGVFTIAIDAQGNKWAGTLDGIYKFNGVTWTTVVFDYVMVRNIAIDKTGNVWAAKYGALKFDGSHWTSYTTANGLPDNLVQCIYIEPDNTKWFGTLKGFAKYDGSNWTSYTTVPGVGTKRVNAINRDSRGDLWIGTSEGGVSRLEHASINITTDTLHVAGNANSRNTFELISNTAWTVESSQDWLSVDKSSGSTNATITVNALKNPVKGSRKALVIVKGLNLKPDTLTVVQDKVPDVLSASVKTLNVDYTAGNPQSFDLISNIAWTAESNRDWLAVSPASGFDNGTITLNVLANTVTAPRSAWVIIKGENVKPDTIIIIQAAIPTELSLSTSVLNVTYTGNNQITCDIQSNAGWTVTSNQDWVTVSPESGINNGVLTMTISDNSGTSLREAIVTVMANGISKELIIIQASMITGFQMVSDKEIQFYPIPVQNKLNIVSLKPFVGALITIYSINGIQLYRSVLNGSTVEIDMSHYPSGIYYAKISNGDGIVLTKKIVK